MSNAHQWRIHRCLLLLQPGTSAMAEQKLPEWSHQAKSMPYHSRQISVLSAILQSANRFWKRALRCGYDLPLKETCFVLMGLLLRTIVTRGVVNGEYCAKLRTMAILLFCSSIYETLSTLRQRLARIGERLAECQCLVASTPA